MSLHGERYIKTERQEKIYTQLHEREVAFQKCGARADVENSFPFENIAELQKIGFTSLTVPKEYGGEEISLYELVLFLEKLGQADGSTGLGLGWHLGIIKDLSERRPWQEDLFKYVCEQAISNGALLNRAATEPKTGSPTRGGKPETTAVKQADGSWRITGRKTFTTMSPVLDFFLIAATDDETETVHEFLVPRNTDGVSIEETWDSIAMTGTGSHDLVLQDVHISADFLVEQNRNERKARPSGWLLHIPAVYSGIAMAARNEALRFAINYSPNSIVGPISELPNVRRLLGEIELKLSQARRLLFTAAKAWDEEPNEREHMTAQLQVAKYTVTNTAINVVDLAMRVVGARSLSAKNPLQRYYRDVRAGLHNPPMDDAVIAMLAEQAIQTKKSK